MELSCKPCGSKDVQKQYGGAGSLALLILGFCGLCMNYYRAANGEPTFPGLLGALTFMALGILGLFRPHYRCRSCKKKVKKPAASSTERKPRTGEKQSKTNVVAVSTLAIFASLAILVGTFLPWVHITNVDVPTTGTTYIFGDNSLEPWTPKKWPWSGTLPAGNLWAFTRKAELEVLPIERSLIFALALGSLVISVVTLSTRKPKTFHGGLAVAAGLCAASLCAFEIAAVYVNMSVVYRFSFSGPSVDLTSGSGPWVCASSGAVLFFIGLSILGIARAQTEEA